MGPAGTFTLTAFDGLTVRLGFLPAPDRAAPPWVGVSAEATADAAVGVRDAAVTP